MHSKVKMEEVNKLLGSLTLQKVGTFQVAALNSVQDAFVARVKNGTTDVISVVAMAPHDDRLPEFMPMSELSWKTVSVRSYSGQKDLVNAMSPIISEAGLSTLHVQNLPKVEWGRGRDFDLLAEKVTQNSTTYKATASIPFKVVLHSTRKNNKHGSELENALEFIPALQTLNFTLVK